MKFLSRLAPRTLFGQILLALFFCLVAVQAAGFWLMLDDRDKLGERLLGGYSAQRIAGIISILEEAEPGERKRLMRSLNVPPARLSLDEAWSTSGQIDGDDARQFLARVAQEMDTPLPVQLLSIRRAEGRRREDGADMRAHSREMAASASPPSDHVSARRLRRAGVLYVVGQARLTDGMVLTFRHSMLPPNLDWPLRLQGLLIALGLSAALLASWMVRRLTRPLAALADAASGLARNLEQPALPETGPQEVARAAQAFNTMQRDLRRYLETRAQALAGVSHDLRLPITRLRLRLERVPDGELREKMEEDLSQMDAMIGHTLEFLRAGATAEKSVRLDINALLESVAEDMAAVGAEVRIHGRASAPIPAHPQALRRCLTNLLDNAHRYGNGTVDIALIERPSILEIRIEDRGSGIPEADLERVFEPYVRMESSRARHTGGSGLGLAIARAIARTHGGDVTLEARPGGGTAAVLVLPRLSVPEA